MRSVAICLLIVLLVACDGPSTPPAEDPEPAPADGDPFRDGQGRLRTDGGHDLLVGRVVANEPLGISNPSEYALEDSKIWKGSPYRVGRTCVFGLDEELAGLVGQVVVVFGARTPLSGLIVEGGDAPADYGVAESIAERRKDWTSPECGFQIGRSTRARLAEIDAWRGEAVFDGGVGLAPMAGVGAVLTFDSPFDRAVSVVVVFQYEQAIGRPGAPYLDERPIEVAPGHRLNASAPVDVDLSGKRFDLHAVRLENPDEESVRFEVALPWNPPDGE